jgi:hypothetical protein
MKAKFDMQKAREICKRYETWRGEPATNIEEAALLLPAALDRIEEQDRRIAELEQAICESEARSLLNFQRFEAALSGEHLTWAQTHDWDACHDDERKDRIAFARKCLKAEGKL